MSLVGNLEDLSLPDILQIVSLSKKSGVLTLDREDRQGKIFIREGRVIQTVSPRAGKSLGEILTGRGLIRAGDLRKALEEQKAGEGRELLGTILVRQGLVREDVLEKVVQGQIEEAIVFFLSWKEGSFSFELRDVESRGEISVDPHAFILERGIDTQWLVLEGTRMLDERRRSGGLEEETATEEADEEERPDQTPAGGGAVVVDDDPVFRDQAAERLSRLNLKVFACDGADQALKALEKLPQAAPPVVVTDIVYPTSDGRGFLGGLELIEKLRRSHPEVPIIAVTAYPDDNVRGKVRDFGVEHFLTKPSGTENDAERVQQEFFEALSRAVTSVAAAGDAAPVPEEAPAAPEREKLVEAIDEKKEEIARQETKIREQARQEDLGKDEMTTLQHMIQELQNPKASSELGLLILRFAAELLNRAVLFVVKGGNAVGLGGFGVEVSSGGRPTGVRGMTISLAEPSILEEVVRRKAAYRGPVVHTAGNVALMQKLGGQTPAEAVAIPLVASGKVRVILYGDNLPESQTLPATRALEIFLGQAGLTLERIILEKRIQEGGAAAR